MTDEFGAQTTERVRFDPALTKPRVLEDLYRHPIGKGTHYMKVTRIAPEVVAGERVAGWLDDVFEPLTSQQFATRFGGGKYRVDVIGPRAGAVDADGNVTPMTLDTLTFQVTGQPVMPNKGNAMNGMPTVLQSGESPEVAKERLRLEREREVAMKEESRKALDVAAAGQSAAIEQITRYGEASLSNLKDQIRELQRAHAEERARLATSIEDKDRELTRLRDELVQTKTNVQNDLRIREQDIERRLREVWEKQVSDAKESAKEKLEDQYRRSKEDADRYQRESTLERERMRNDQERSERALRETYESRLRELKETGEARVRELERELDRSKADLTSLSQRELMTVRQMADIQVTQASATAQAQIKSIEATRDFLQIQYEAAKTEIVNLRRELDETRAKMHKSPNEYIRETIEMAETLGYERADGSSDGDDEEKKESTAEKIMNVVTQVAPAVMNTIGSMQGARAGAQRSGAEAVAQTRQRMAQRRRMLPPNMVPPMAAASLPQVGLLADSLPPAPVGPVVVPPPPAWSPDVYAQPSASQPPPPMPQPEESRTEQVAQPTSAAPPAPVPTEIPEDAGQQLTLFYNHIASAYDNGTEPKSFASMVITTLGKDRVAAMLQQIPAKDFIRILKENAGDQKIALLDLGGQKYVNDVWAAAQDLIA